MPFIVPSQETMTFTGTGEGVCLNMKCGLGDCVQALPIIAELKEPVTILTELNKLEFWQLVRETIPITILTQTPLMKAGFDDPEWVESAKKQYARIHIMRSWSTWETPLVRDTMDAFAEAVQGTVPKSFSFHAVLQPERSFASNYILFAPDSTEDVRSLSEEKAEEVFRALQREYGNVVWLSTFRPKVDGDEFVELCDTIDDNDELREAMLKQRAEAEAKERIRMIGKTECGSFVELRDIIYNADYVVTAESGVSNLAAALSKEMTVLCSVTDPLHIIGQYKRFHAFEYTVVRGDSKCAPCWRKAEHGFLGTGCNCINTIAPEQILQTIPILQ